MDRISVIMVDDDVSARNMVKGFLRNSGTYKITDFSDSRRALDWLKENRADIAICDMNMPLMDGVEFISVAAGICPELHFIAISGYSDFRYLRECIVHSVEDYLLKHNLTAELLVGTLDRVAAKYQIRPAAEERYPQGHLFLSEEDFSAEKIRQLAKEGLIHIDPSVVFTILISPDYDPDSCPGYGVFVSGAAAAVPDIIAQVLDNRYQYILHIDGAQIALLLSLPGMRYSAGALAAARSLCLKMLDRAGRLLNITLTIGLAPGAAELETALKYCDPLRSLAAGKLYRGPGVFFSLEREEEHLPGTFSLPSHYIEQFRLVLGFADYSAAGELIHRLFAEMIRVRCDKHTVVDVCTRLSGLFSEIAGKESWKTEEKRIEDYEFIEHFERYMLRRAEDCVNQIQKKKPVRYSIAVARAVSFIEEHFYRDISLEECAEQVGISYTHLSHIFRKETGKGFSEYLNRFRIGRAKVFLAEKKYSIKEILDKVGFRNYNYFFKVFKEIEGVTPNEYIGFANDGAPFRPARV
ncbi:MAG: helix-turn-helix domain-containing protein [Treponema sp.]|jgi:YesN/AraC family two-component response regulator|nr:helix-turn-helix domain-containing protein [Treponema sp.]